MLHSATTEAAPISHHSSASGTMSSSSLNGNTQVNALVSHQDSTTPPPILLPTAVVNVHDHQEQKHQVRVLIDQGSECLFLALP